jgi:acyl-coenzyme A thioesterase PaaI-like protein
MGSNTVPIQEYYDDTVSYCYGCGRLNEHGLHIESFWDGREAICVFEPQPYHHAIPGFVYGGLIASLIDCHCTGTAAAAAYEAAGRALGSKPHFRYVTASLHVDYIKPTPMGTPLKLKAKVKSMSGRKVIVTATVESNGDVTAMGEVLVVQMPGEWVERADSTMRFLKRDT